MHRIPGPQANTPARNRSHIQLLYRYTVMIARAKSKKIHKFGKINVMNDKHPLSCQFPPSTVFSIRCGQIVQNVADKMPMKLRKARMISGCFSYCFSKPKVVVYVNNTHNCLCHADLDFRKEYWNEIHRSFGRRHG